MSPVRLLAALVASVLLVAAAVAVDRARPDPGNADEPAAAPSPHATGPIPDDTDTPAPEPSPSPSDPLSAPEELLALLTSTDEAATAGAEDLLAAGLEVAQGPWRTLSTPDWPVRDERPVYVAEVTIGARGARVDGDVVIAWRQAGSVDRLVLRALAASEVLQSNGGALEATVELDGEEVEFEQDAEGARIVVPQPLEDGTAHLARIRFGYDLVEGARLDGQGGPAGFGLLARMEGNGAEPRTANLGHWLPLLTFDRGPMVEWGDVGAFPTAIWSVIVDHPGTLVTGGEDGECPEDRATERVCTWARGVSLRDVSGVWFADEPRVDSQRVGTLEVNAIAPAGTFDPETNQQALTEAAGGAELFEDGFGALAWREFDVVAGELLEGAAGMEFPGLVIIDLDVYGAVNGGFGTYVIAHEVAHQWFHALVGNGSLSSPVIDESVAQYLSYLYWARAYGEEAADEFAREAIRARYLEARQQGLVDEPPAQPLADFAGDRAYGVLVYARAPLAWLAAEDALGRGAVRTFLRSVVAEYGLGRLSDDELLDEAVTFDPQLGEILQRYWFDAAPVAGQSG